MSAAVVKVEVVLLLLLVLLAGTGVPSAAACKNTLGPADSRCV